MDQPTLFVRTRELDLLHDDCAGLYGPIRPYPEDGQEPFSMFVDLQKYHWLLKPVIEYSSVDRLILARLANVITSWVRRSRASIQRVARACAGLVSAQVFC
jgi:hypothetical protein